MFTANNPYLLQQKAVLTNDTVSLQEARFTLDWNNSAVTAATVAGDLTLNNIGAVGILPAAAIPKFITLDADLLDSNATPTLQFSLGVMAPKCEFWGYINGTTLAVLQVLSNSQLLAQSDSGGAVTSGLVLTTAPVLGSNSGANQVVQGTTIASGTTINVGATGTMTVSASQTLGSATAPVLFTGYGLSTLAQDGGGVWATGLKTGQLAADPTAAFAVESASNINNPLFTYPMARCKAVNYDRILGLQVTAVPATANATLGTTLELGLTLFYREA